MPEQYYPFSWSSLPHYPSAAPAKIAKFSPRARDSTVACLPKLLPLAGEGGSPRHWRGETEGVEGGERKIVLGKATILSENEKMGNFPPTTPPPPPAAGEARDDFITT